MSDIIDTEPVPAGGGVNKPSSGTYGEKAAVQRLEQQLPPVPGPGAGNQGQSPPPGPGSLAPVGPPQGGQGGESPIPGVPAPIFAPTNQPNTPVGTPLAGPGEAPAVATPSQAHLRVVEALKQDENPEVAEWATLVFDYLVSQTRNE